MNTFVELTRDSLYSVVFHLAPRFANVFLFILISRLAGPSQAGVFALAATYLLIFTTFTRGLDDLVVRQVSREPERAAHYLFNFLILRLGVSLLIYGVLLFVVRVVFDYTESTAYPILILSLSLVPDGITYVAQSILLGQRRFAAPALILASASFFKLMGGGIIVFMGGSLQQVAWVWFAGSSLAMMAMLVIVIRRTRKPRRADWLSWEPLKRHWRVALSFLFITTLATLETQTDTILLSGFHNEAEVGWYGAATTIAYSLIMFSQAYRFAVYPLMSRYAVQAPQKLFKLYEQSVRYLGILVLPMVAGIVLLSPRIVPFVFGPQFQPTIPVLEILILTLIFMFLNEPNIRMMLVHDRQNRIALFLSISTTINVILNFALAPTWGALGAAVARVCSAMSLFSLSYIYITRSFTGLNILRTLFKPVLATLAMALVLWPWRDWPLSLTISIGIVTYVGTLWLVGGISPDEITLLYQTAAKQRKRTASNEVK